MIALHLQIICRLVLLAVYFTIVMSVSSTATTSEDPLQNSKVDKSCVTGESPNQCETQENLSSIDNSPCADVPADSASNAVVLYRPTALHAFREESKQFTFVGRELVIKQKWEDLGVAAVVWDAAVVLAEYLEKNSKQFPLRGKQVIELGAGTGLVGMVAALLGANVIATDREKALKFLQENIQENFPCSEKSRTVEENAQCKKKDTAGDDSLNIKVMELDWGKNHKDFSPDFDYIFGADIIYIEETFQQLLETLLHLSNSDRKSRILLSCRIRYDRDVRFLKMMEDQYKVEEIYHDGERDIKIYQAELISKHVRNQENL